MKTVGLATLLCLVSMPCISMQAQSASSQTNAQSGQTKTSHIENVWGIPVEVESNGVRKPLWKGDGDKVKSAPVVSVDSPQAKVHPSAIQKPAAMTPQKPIVKDEAPKNGTGAVADHSGNDSTQPADTSSANTTN